jgi:predicted permease
MARVRPGADTQAVGRSLTRLLRAMLVEERVNIASGQLEAHRIEARTASQGIETLRRRVSKPLVALMALVGLVLLVTCANIANLQLARGAARQREMAVRLSVGAGRGRLVRQLLVESLLLSTAGGVAALLVAYGCIHALLALLDTGKQPLALQAGLDARTLLFTAGASMGAGILFGVAPAWRASRLDADAVVKVGGTDARTRAMPSRLLVVAQVALALVLVVGAGLLARTFQNLVSLDAGFDRDNLLAVAVDPQMAGVRGARVATFYQRTLERVSRLPGVRAASFERNEPLSGGGSLSTIRPAGYAGDPELVTWFEEVGPRYAETLGLPVMAGRDLRDSDDAQAPRVMLINEAAAAVFFPGHDPVGRRMGDSERSSGYEIVGVVANMRHQSLREAPRVTVYLPALQDPQQIRNTSLLVRTAGDPAALAPAVRQIVRELEPSVPVMHVTTLADVAAGSLVSERLTATLATVFGALALLVAGVGLSGVLLFGVARRTRELGVRMALGATMQDVARLVLRESTLVVGAGILIGLPCAWAAARLAQTLLFGLSPGDPVTLAAAVALLAVVTALASVTPARRAAAVDPVIALRTD